MAQKVGGAFVSLAASAGRFQKDMETARKAAKRTGKGMKKSFKGAKHSSKSLTKSLTSMRSAIIALGSAMVIGATIRKAVSEFASMERGLREIGTLMGGLTDKQMKDMGHELEVLAAKTGQAMDKLVKARYDIVSAGFAEAADSAKVLAAAADLAAGGNTEAANAADVLTTALNAYGLSADHAIDISDKLFTIVRLGKTDMDLIGGSLGRVTAIAAQVGVDLDEVGAALAALTADGQSTEEAVTAIRSTMVEFLKPGKKMLDLIKATGYESGVALIKQEGFAGAIKLVKKKADELGIPLTDVISNVRSMQAILPLSGTAAEKFAEGLEDMKDSSGATSTAVEEMNKSFSRQLERLRENVNNIMRQIGKAVTEIIQPMVEDANAVLGTFGEIGWDKISKDLTTNWRDTLEILGRLVAVMLQPIPDTVAAIFKLAGKGAVGAFKLGIDAMSDINWGEMIFGSPAKNVAMAMAKTFGTDVANQFIDSGFIGSMDALKGGFGAGTEISRFLYDEYTKAVDSGINPTTHYLTDKFIDAIGVSTGNIITDTKTKSFVYTMVRNFMTNAAEGARIDTKDVFGDWRVTEGIDLDSEMASLRGTWSQSWGESAKEANAILEAFFNDLVERNRETGEENKKTTVESEKEKIQDVVATNIDGSFRVKETWNQAEIEMTLNEQQQEALRQEARLVAWTARSELANQVTSQLMNLGNQMLAHSKAVIQSELQTKEDAELAKYKAEKQRIIRTYTVGGELTEKGQEKLQNLEQGHHATLQNLRDDAQRKEKDASKKLKPMKYAQAITNTAVAVTNMLAVKAPPPIPFVLAGLAAAAGAAEIATIKAQPFGKGGIIGEPTTFNISEGFGIAGEAGAEGLLPLTRMSGGDMGVRAEVSGGGQTIFKQELNFEGPITDRDYVREFIIPEIEDNSRKLLSKIVTKA